MPLYKAGDDEETEELKIVIGVTVGLLGRESAV
jgi:hypothetical protein